MLKKQHHQANKNEIHNMERQDIALKIVLQELQVADLSKKISSSQNCNIFSLSNIKVYFDGKETSLGET